MHRSRKSLSESGQKAIVMDGIGKPAKPIKIRIVRI
jgi:hypothetical protein